MRAAVLIAATALIFVIGGCNRPTAESSETSIADRANALTQAADDTTNAMIQQLDAEANQPKITNDQPATPTDTKAKK